MPAANSRVRSLNHKILTGPDHKELKGVLHRFREKKVGIVADIDSMFNNFYVQLYHRDLLRFY